MELVDIRIRNYRTIHNEQYLHLPGKMTLVGPNNSGKTNLLLACQTLFTGYNNIYGYSRNKDLTFDVGRERTSIVATFDGSSEENDSEIYNELDSLYELQQRERKSSKFTLTLYFTETNTPVYNLFPNIKRPTSSSQNAQFSRIHKSLVNKILNKFAVHYVPSAKSVNQIYHDLLIPFLRREVARVMEPYIDEISEAINQAANDLNRELSNAGIESTKASFDLPYQSLEKLISSFDFMLEDTQKTPIEQKGMGMQATALHAAFRWITTQENKDGKSVIWLLEEPESYLHPELSCNFNKILENLANDSLVIKTTHDMGFVPQNPNYVCGTLLNKNSRTEIYQFRTYYEATAKIRESLGVKFSDFYALDQFNVMVEGPSDRNAINKFINMIPISLRAWEYLRNSKIEDFGGVKHLAGFLRATYQFIKHERACVALFDGDEAGSRERRNLQQYFSQKEISFQPNLHYVSVRSGYPIEGLFPDEWLIEIYNNHPNWFDTFSVDASNNIEPFKIKDSKKSNVLSQLFEWAEQQSQFEWAERFLQVCDSIDQALKWQVNRLELTNND